MGYAGQDYKLWKSEDYVMQFEGLLEDYKKVTVTIYILITRSVSFCLQRLPCQPCRFGAVGGRAGEKRALPPGMYHAVRFFFVCRT